MVKKKISTDAFIAAWETAESLDDVVAATGLKRFHASVTATRLRKRGVTLKKFSERAQRAESLSDRAARAAHDEGMTYDDAAAQYGISRQAVHQSYARLYPRDTRPIGMRSDHTARAVVVELARAGRSDDEIADEVGFCAQYVSKIRLDAGINYIEAKGVALRSAVEAVRGGASVAHAAADHGVSYTHLLVRCRADGVSSVKRGGQRNGSAVAAADLVERGAHTVAEAAREMGCAPPGVYAMLKRRRLARAQ